MNKPQMKQYELLCEIDRICRKNSINYYLDSGTLLGAVRHQGFIPWDDDIDVGMFRKDYEKFKSILNEELNNKYLFQNYESDSNFGFVFGKLRIKNTKYTEQISKKTKAKDGIFIDIFPFDNACDDEKKHEKNFKKVVIFRMMLLLKQRYIINTSSLIKKIEKLILRILSIFVTKKFIIKKINKIINLYNYETTKCICNFSTAYFKKNRYDRDWFSDIAILKFEDKEFLCPKNYDEYLKYLYNDYMKLPPENKRINHSIVNIKYEDE